MYLPIYFIKCINAVKLKTSIKYSKLPRIKVLFLHYKVVNTPKSIALHITHT